MSPSAVADIRAWFDGYVAPYRDTDPEGLRNIDLKIAHTHRVCEMAEALCDGEQLSPDERCTALVSALLHDVGRFPQYRRWRTFRDSESDNHARLSVEVIREAGLLDRFGEGERLLIEEAVRFHNLLDLPERFQSPTSLFIRLIRDADKLDIWRVFLDQDSRSGDERASAANLGLPDEPGLTPACREALQEGRVVRLDECIVLNDFKLLQMSWALDLNFRTSFRIVRERRYLPLLAATMNRPGDVAGCLETLMAEVERRAA